MRYSMQRRHDQSHGTSKALKQATPPDPVQGRSCSGHEGPPGYLGGILQACYRVAVTLRPRVRTGSTWS